MIRARENPFASHRVDALAYRFEHGCWEELGTLLHRQGYRGAIIGPYGSGKTTLLEQLAKRLRIAGRESRRIFVNAQRPRLTAAQWREVWRAAARYEVVLIDGADLLPWWQWQAVRCLCFRSGGLVVAAHRRCGLPVLHRCSSSVAQLRRLLADLDVPLTADEARRLYEDHRGDIRAVFRALYLRLAAGDITGFAGRAAP
ncbi:MAG: hypothetical protein KC897_02745 [Candidatus Omnitrophica bacterium]|nr:hypothetical protein [Candidatus Omnitrophota bacterium]MCB9722234.1 hypothetical protein [Candidatus Omnitrophota bacterium]